MLDLAAQVVAGPLLAHRHPVTRREFLEAQRKIADVGAAAAEFHHRRLGAGHGGEALGVETGREGLIRQARRELDLGEHHFLEREAPRASEGDLERHAGDLVSPDLEAVAVAVARRELYALAGTTGNAGAADILELVRSTPWAKPWISRIDSMLPPER